MRGHKSKGLVKSDFQWHSSKSETCECVYGLGSESYEVFLQDVQNEFRAANGNPDAQFNAINRAILGLATKKKGSQFLQTMLSDASESLVNKIFKRIDNHFKELMCDNYGNYFVSKLI